VDRVIHKERGGVERGNLPLAQVDRGAVGGGAGERDGQRVRGWGEVDRGRGGCGVVHVAEVLVDGAGRAVDKPFSILGIEIVFT
jgi:hypothetical protein